MRAYPTEDGSVVRFETLTETAEFGGKGAFNKCVVAVVVNPGLTKSEAVHRMVETTWDGRTEEHPAMDRFRRQYDAWISDADPALLGTPLSELAQITHTQIDQLKRLQITTVEALASISDTALQALGMGARELRDRAKAHVSDHNRVARSLADENAALRARIEALEALAVAPGDGPKGKGVDADLAGAPA